MCKNQKKYLQINYKYIFLSKYMLLGGLVKTQESFISIHSWSVPCNRSVVFSAYSGFLHQWNWPPWYNWNIVESGVEHNKPTNYFVYFRYEELEAKLIAEKLSPLDSDPPKIIGKPASDDTEKDKKAIVKIVDNQKGNSLIIRAHQSRWSGHWHHHFVSVIIHLFTERFPGYYF